MRIFERSCLETVEKLYVQVLALMLSYISWEPELGIAEELGERDRCK